MNESEGQSGPEEKKSRKYAIRAADRVCDILDAVRVHRDGASLSDLARVTAMPKSSVFRYLSVLEERSYVYQDPETTNYRPGLAFQQQDVAGRERLTRIADPLLHRLRDEIGETVNLGVFDNGQVLHLAVVESVQSMRLAAKVGDRGLIHSTALGKVMAATMGAEAVLSVLRMHGMPAYTAMTLTTESAYVDQLAMVHSNGFAIDDSENQIGGRCVAVLIPGLSMLAGLSVSAPEQQVSLERVPEVAARLKVAAAELSRLIRG